MYVRELKKIFQNIRAKMESKLFSRSDVDKENRKIQVECEKRLAKPQTKKLESIYH